MKTYQRFSGFLCEQLYKKTNIKHYNTFNQRGNINASEDFCNVYMHSMVIKEQTLFFEGLYTYTNYFEKVYNNLFMMMTMISVPKKLVVYLSQDIQNTDAYIDNSSPRNIIQRSFYGSTTLDDEFLGEKSQLEKIEIFIN